MFSTWIQQASPSPSPTNCFSEFTLFRCWLYKRELWKAQKIDHEPAKACKIGGFCIFSDILPPRNPKEISTLVAKIICIPSNCSKRSWTMKLYTSGAMEDLDEFTCLEGLKQARRPAPRGLPFQSSLVYLSPSQAVEM